MRFFRPFFLVSRLFPEVIFRIKTSDKLICLTFDDGPDPGSTPHILDILEKHDIRAIFFCNGRSAEKYTYLVDVIRKKKHLIGNHGYNHLNGWFTSIDKYCNDVNYASGFTSARLFRPPYGRMRFRQYRIIKKTCRIVMWDVMPYDFDKGSGSENVLKVLKQKIRPGSIIVFHDTPGSIVPELLNDFIVFAENERYGFVLPEL